MIGSGGVLLTLAAAFVLYALSGQIVYFYMPTDVVEKNVQPGTRMRLGGLVEEGSVVRSDDSVVTFTLTDNSHTVKVNYKGLLPDLFREGQGIVAEGTMEPDGGFKADNVLAKHDENYMPREVAEALKENGVWNESGGVRQ
jgi:cytochrome c-type biogenesis protein CcmE